MIKRRHDRLFSGISTVRQWEQRKQRAAAPADALARHALAGPSTTSNGHEQTGLRSLHSRNLVLETVPGVFLTANLCLPRGVGKAVPVLLYQCGHANKSLFRRHGAWFASNGMAMLVMDNIEMGEIEFTHHGVYANAWFHW